MSSRASSWVEVWSFSRVSRMDSYWPNSSRICASVQPRALSSTVTFCLRLRSRRTPTMSRLSISNSSHAPRLGIILQVKMSLSEVLSVVCSK